MPPSYKYGFTLVELAIVIVIIGLITGGVLGSQSLIESAKIRESITGINSFKTALNAFKLEFDSLPGDLTDAYDYFGDECGTDSNQIYIGCNGDGDKCLDGLGGCPPTNEKSGGDSKRSFVHLNLSGIMPNIAYDPDPTSGECAAGESHPLIGDNIVTLFSRARGKVHLQIIGSETHFVGGRCSTNGTSSFAFTPRQADSIDKKIDDGNAILGFVKANILITADSYGADCSESSNGSYEVSNSDSECNLRIDLN